MVHRIRNLDIVNDSSLLALPDDDGCGNIVRHGAGVASNDLIKRFAKVTGSVLLGIFGVDLILFWLQGVGRGDWLRWFMLAAELGIGITLLRLAGMQSKLNPT